MDNLKLAAVVIGRNEGERLKACLNSLKAYCDSIVYVDSGSSDDSIAFAKALGVTTVELDSNQFFSAARARNAGFNALMSSGSPDIVQFVDGDCLVTANWLKAGHAALATNPALGLVTGWRSELHPDMSIYNAMCDVEWHRPAGKITTCGGDMMVRTHAFQQVGGFNPAVIAAEDDEFCLRLGKAGWELQRLPMLMTRHDANMTSFRQWWKRSIRNGHGFAQVGTMHPPHLRIEQFRVWFYGLVLPVLSALGLATVGLPALMLLLLYPISFLRTAAKLIGSGLIRSQALGHAALLTISKFPNLIGMLTYHYRRWAGRNIQIIEYK